MVVSGTCTQSKKSSDFDRNPDEFMKSRAVSCNNLPIRSQKGCTPSYPGGHLQSSPSHLSTGVAMSMGSAAPRNRGP